MSMNHFSIFFAFLLAMSVSSSCQKEKVQLYRNDAEILSRDNSMRPCNVNDPCNCPGGFYIQIDGVANPHGKCIGCTSFKTLKFPGGFELSNTTVFPVPVIIEWKYDKLSCDSSRIIITSIRRRS